jgi:DNA-binding MarR family transcriptional regulator
MLDMAISGSYIAPISRYDNDPEPSSDQQNRANTMTSNIRLSRPALRMLKLFLEKPLEGKSGAEISRALGISSGTVYPLLSRFEKAGWLTGEWEIIDPAEAGRPRRRFYKLTALGQNNASRELADLQTVPGVVVWNS